MWYRWQWFDKNPFQVADSAHVSIYGNSLLILPHVLYSSFVGWLFLEYWRLWGCPACCTECQALEHCCHYYWIGACCCRGTGCPCTDCCTYTLDKILGFVTVSMPWIFLTYVLLCLSFWWCLVLTAKLIGYCWITVLPTQWVSILWAKPHTGNLPLMSWFILCILQ